MSVGAGAIAPARGDASTAWTPARAFLAASALYHLVLGAVGFVADRTFPLSTAAAARADSEHIFGVFETNGWHSLAAVFLGVVSLYFVLRPHRARAAAIAIGASQLAVVVGLALWDPSVFLLASNGADQVIHSLTAIAGIGAGLLTRTETSARYPD
jgi:hypothetical protein